MGKKLLVILGITAIAGYLFRDRVIAAGLDLGAKLNAAKESLGWVEDDSPDLSDYSTMKGNE